MHDGRPFGGFAHSSHSIRDVVAPSPMARYMGWGVSQIHRAPWGGPPAAQMELSGWWGSLKAL